MTFAAQTLEAQKNAEPPRHPGQDPARLHEQGSLQLVAPQVVYCRAPAQGQWLTPADLLALQRTMGNRGVQRMVARRVDSVNGLQPSALAEETPGIKVATKLTVDARKGWSAHGLTPEVQQGVANNEIKRQALPVPVRPPVPMRPPLRSLPGGRTSPGSGGPIRTPEGAPRYAPDPYDDSLEAALERANIQDYAEQQRIKQERPVATLDRGGQPPGFITEHGTRRYEWLERSRWGRLSHCSHPTSPRS